MGLASRAMHRVERELRAPLRRSPAATQQRARSVRLIPRIDASPRVLLDATPAFVIDASLWHEARSGTRALEAGGHLRQTGAPEPKASRAKLLGALALIS